MKAAISTPWSILASVVLAGGLAGGLAPHPLEGGAQQVAAAEPPQRPSAVGAAGAARAARAEQPPEPARPVQTPALRLPWKQAGLTERQAAAHLLNRFAFGPRPGEIDQVIAIGLDRWFERQLAADLPDPNLEARLRDLPALAMTEADMVRIYRNPGQVLAEAVKEGVISKDEQAAAKADPDLKRLYARGPGGGNGRNGGNGGRGGSGAGAAAAAAPAAAGAAAGNVAAGAAIPELDRPELRAKLLEFARERGYRPERELQGQLVAQKLLRAVDSQNQLREVMTDFWFNHFNISQTNGRARPYLLAYERDALRPNALGTVRRLLEATARHPAMLYYLDNADSTAAPEAPTLLGDQMQAMQAFRPPAFRGPHGGFGRPPGPAAKPPNRPKGHGLNENYARELMELHTLGVDGGYTQQDVIEVARAFTGWTVLPSGPGREAAEKRLEQVRRFGGLGFRLDGDFLFRADMHDSAGKLILGRQLPAGRGIEDGERVLDMLAAHPSTARHLATKLAVRFVSDKPPQPLIDRLVAAYDRSGGEVRAMLRTLVQSPELWSREAVGAKVKSPFELAVSAVRASGAHVEDPRPLLAWIGRMGEPLYGYQAPTGYPDRADAWVNTGSLLNRMNFGLQFASQRIAGVDMDLPSLHDGPEPESREAALHTYASLLLPGRDLAPTLRLLGPMVADPAVAHRVDAAAPKESPREARARDDEDDMTGVAGGGRAGAGAGAAALPRFAADTAEERRSEVVRVPQPQHLPTPIEQVVGVIFGSPEFQRR
jgi:uncharacterized protein (DUF1800 family)